jgi:hypothetical protein
LAVSPLNSFASAATSASGNSGGDGGAAAEPNEASVNNTGTAYRMKILCEPKLGYRKVAPENLRALFFALPSNKSMRGLL